MFISRYKVKNLYFDFWYLLLKPRVIHFEFAIHLREHLHLNKLVPVKMIGSFRGSDLFLNGLTDPNYFKDIWKIGDSFHFLGKKLYETALEKGLSPEKKTVLIAPAINDALFNNNLPSASPKIFNAANPLKIISVGRLHWTKGLEWALIALSKCVEKKIPFQYTIVGDGPMLEAVVLARHHLKLEPYITLNLAVHPGDLPSLLAQHHVFLQASVSEGFCNAVVEAQAMGLACIVSDAGGLPENIAPDETGVVVPRRDPEKMAEAIEWFYHNPDKINQYGQAGIDRVKKHFVLADQIEKFHAWYMDTLQIHKTSSIR